MIHITFKIVIYDMVLYHFFRVDRDMISYKKNRDMAQLCVQVIPILRWSYQERNHWNSEKNPRGCLIVVVGLMCQKYFKGNGPVTCMM